MMEVRGRDLISGLLQDDYHFCRESYEAIVEPVDSVITAVKEVLRKPAGAVGRYYQQRNGDDRRRSFA